MEIVLQEIFAQNKMNILLKIIFQIHQTLHLFTKYKNRNDFQKLFQCYAFLLGLGVIGRVIKLNIEG
jgi:hypothetical protein